MNAKRMLNRLDACGVPMIIRIFPGDCLLPDANLIIGEPLELKTDYLTFMHDHVCQNIIAGLGQPDTIIHTNNSEFIYYLWKIE